jgi:ABC-2 type transport system permease protein
MRPELIVAEKEFRDHITSKRFVVIFGIMLLLGIYAINSGMDNYNQQLDQYKNTQMTPDYQYKQQTIDSLQKQIQDARDQNQSAEYIQMLKNNLDSMLNPTMPSILQVFQSMLMLFMYLGMVLGASLGFDQIAREKDEGSLKFLVSSPIYRDAIINSKTIGAIAALAAAMAAAFTITIGIMLLKGVTPGAEDMIRIFLFFIASLLYCTVFFALAMLVSTISKNTAVAAILTVGMVFVVFIYTMMASWASFPIAEAIVGPAPGIDYSNVPTYTVNTTGENVTYNYPQTYDNSGMSEYKTRLYQTHTLISDLLGILSPLNDYCLYSGYGHMSIGPAMITKIDISYYFTETGGGSFVASDQMSVLDSLASVWLKVLAILAEIVIAFGISYVIFMRADVR